MLHRSALDSIIMKLWGLCQKRLSSDALLYSTSKSLRNNANTKPSSIGEGIRLRVESVIWFFISLVLALFVPVISYIISLTGGLAASFIFLFPGLILLQLMLRSGSETVYSKWQRVCFVLLGCLITTLGTFIFGLSIVYTIMHDANLF